MVSTEGNESILLLKVPWKVPEINNSTIDVPEKVEIYHRCTNKD